MKPISVEHAEHYQWGEGCDGWHLLKQDDLSVIQEQVPPGKCETKHLHRQAHQFFYILSGHAVMVVGDTQIPLKSFQGIEIPPGVPHQFRNDSDKEVTFLVVSAPKSHGDREDV